MNLTYIETSYLCNSFVSIAAFASPIYLVLAIKSAI